MVENKNTNTVSKKELTKVINEKKKLASEKKIQDVKIKELEAKLLAAEEVKKEKVTIGSSDEVEITSMVSNLTLNTHNGLILAFSAQYETIPVRMEELRGYVRKDRSFFEKGYVRIESKLAAKMVGLGTIYEKMMTAEELQDLINIGAKEFEKIYLESLPVVKTHIRQLLIQQEIKDSGSVDYAKVRIVDEFESKRNLYQMEIRQEADVFIKQLKALKE